MALSAGQVSLGVKPDTSKFGSDLAAGIGGQAGLFDGIGKKIGGLLVGGVAAVGLGESVKKVFETGWDEAKDASAGAAQLAAGIKSTGNAANVSVSSMENLASSIQGMSGQTDDSIVGAEQLLLTFTNIKNVGPDKIFDQATQAAADMAAKMGGDASSNAILLGKALNDPVKGVTALTRVGVSFTQAQKDSIAAMVKSGDTMGAQKLILGELNTEYGGAAKAAGESLPGMLNRGKRAFEDMSQAIVEGLLPVIQPAIGALVAGMQVAGPAIGNFVGSVSAKLAALVDILHTGDFSAAFREAFHVEEDSPIVGVLLNIRSAFLDTKAILTTGFTENESILPPSVVTGLRGVRDLFLEVGPVVSRVASVFAAEVRPALATLGASFAPVIATIQSAFAGLWPTIQPLIPGIIRLVVAFSPLHAILTAIGPYLPQLVQSFGLLAAALVGTVAGALTTALPALTALGAVLSNTLVVAIRAILPLVFSLTDFLSHNAAIIGVVVGAYVAWRVASASISFAQVIVGLASSTAAWVANAAAVIASKSETVILMGMYAGDFVASIARNVAGVAVSTGAWIANTAAQVAAKAVILGGVAAMGIATAAQWLWNVAMDANPIGIIILAIGALVAAILWVATQTTFFQDAWKACVSAVGAAWNWLWASVLKPTFDAIGAAFNWLVRTIVMPYINLVIAYVHLWAAIFTWLYQSVIQPVFAGIGSAFSWVWNNGIRPVIDGITGAIRTVGTTVHDVFGGIGDFIGGAFRTAASLVRGPMNTIIGLVNGAIDGVNSVGGAFGVHINHIPMLAKGGTITGAGQVIVGENGPELLTLPTGATVNPNINAGNNAASGDRPIYADGVGLIAWIRELANGEARLVWAQGEQATATAAGMGWSVNR